MTLEKYMAQDYYLHSLVINILLIAIIVFLIKKMLKDNKEFKEFKFQRDNDILEARKDSVKKQRATIKGQISETLAPWSMTVVDSVSELNFLGNPIDFIGFKGLDGKGDVDIKFIEVKSGKSKLNQNQKRVRDAVIAKRIEWVETRISEIPIEEKLL